MISSQTTSSLILECDPTTNQIALDWVDLPGSERDKGGKVLLAYRRSTEYDDHNGKGQDDAWLYADRDRVAAVLADGASQSFYGHIAAQGVVKGLQRLMTTCSLEAPEKAFEKTLIAELRRLAQEGAKIVRDYPVREGISEAMAESLEEARSQGSQAVFAAFLYSRATQRLLVCQLGDVRLRVFGEENGMISSYLLPAKKMGRFSTRATADLADESLTDNLVIQSFHNVLGVLIHCDGVDDQWGEKPAALEPAQQDELRKSLECWASNDDVSAVGVLTAPVRAWAAKNSLLPPPKRETPQKPPVPRGDTPTSPAAAPARFPGVGAAVLPETKIAVSEPLPGYGNPSRAESAYHIGKVAVDPPETKPAWNPLHAGGHNGGVSSKTILGLGVAAVVFFGIVGWRLSARPPAAPANPPVTTPAAQPPGIQPPGVPAVPENGPRVGIGPGALPDSTPGVMRGVPQGQNQEPNTMGFPDTMGFPASMPIDTLKMLNRNKVEMSKLRDKLKKQSEGKSSLLLQHELRAVQWTINRLDESLKTLQAAPSEETD